MSTGSARLTVSGVGVDVIYKKIKHLHIAVYPPNGRVRVAAPDHVNADVVRLAVVRRMSWIKRQQRQLADVERHAEREMVTGESQYVWGRRLRLRLIKRPGPSHIEVDGDSLLLLAPVDMSEARRRQVLEAWYREQLRSQIPAYLDHWSKRMELAMPEWHIRRMKTKWGSCNQDAARVLFNSALALKHPECLEYVVVHELTHLMVRGHGPAFTRQMDHIMPNWTTRRDHLNDVPLPPYDWTVAKRPGGVD